MGGALLSPDPFTHRRSADVQLRVCPRVLAPLMETPSWGEFCDAGSSKAHLDRSSRALVEGDLPSR